MIQAFIKYAIGLINGEPGYTLTNAKKYFGRDYELFLSFYHNLLCSGKAIAEYQKRKDKGWDLPQLAALALAFTKRAIDSIKKVIEASTTHLHKQADLLVRLKQATSEIEQETKTLNLDYSKLLNLLNETYRKNRFLRRENSANVELYESQLNTKAEILNKPDLTAEEIESLLVDTFQFTIKKVANVLDKTNQVILKSDRVIVSTVDVLKAIGEVATLTDQELQAELTQQIQMTIDQF